MSYQVKQRIFSGAVCEQEVYSISSRYHTRRNKSKMPPLRLRDPAAYQKHKDGIGLRNFIRMFNENFSPSSIYSTLTFDAENEVHDFRDARILRERYYKKLKKLFPDSVPLIVMGRGKSTNRIHFHMVSEGIPVEAIAEQWTYGKIIESVNLREHNYYNGIDFGQDYTALAKYLWRHWTPEQGGKHYKISRNAKKPTIERPTEPVTPFSLSRPPRAPKGYVFVEAYRTEYGFYHFKYVRMPEKDPKCGSRGSLLFTCNCKLKNQVSDGTEYVYTALSEDRTRRKAESL